MKVNLHWGAKNSNAKFRVDGADLESVCKTLNNLSEWGKFEGSFPFSWKGDAQENVIFVRIEPTFTITMPTWPGYRNQPQECKDAWDAMWRALEKHENGHREIFERGVSKIVSDLEAMEDIKGSEINTLIQKAEKAIQDEHDKFDRETDNGRSRGVNLTISDKCKSRLKGSDSD